MYSSSTNLPRPMRLFFIAACVYCGLTIIGHSIHVFSMFLGWRFYSISLRSISLLEMPFDVVGLIGAIHALNRRPAGRALLLVWAYAWLLVSLLTTGFEILRISSLSFGASGIGSTYYLFSQGPISARNILLPLLLILVLHDRSIRERLELDRLQGHAFQVLPARDLE